MGKVYKRKLRSCALCKPWKRGWAKRNKIKVQAKINSINKEINKTKNNNE